MNWVKRHKLWSLSFLYFGAGILVSLLGIVNPLEFGEMMGLFFLPYFFVCFITLKILEKQQGKEDEKT